MFDTKEPMTLEGKKALEKELQELKSIKRPQIIEAIAEARALGDLKENAEYHAAKEDQGRTEARIQQIESQLARAAVVDIASIPQTGKVVFGTTVALLNLDNDQEVTYKIVGNEESDVKANKISFSSPLARVLLGKEEGDVVTVKTPSGYTEYEITEVCYL